MYNTPETWTSVSCVVCVSGYTWKQSVPNIRTQRRVFTHYEQGVINIFRIWVIFPWHSSGSLWFVELSRVEAVPADLKTLQSGQRALFSQGLGGLVLEGQDFLLRLFILLTDDWGRIRAEAARGTTVVVVAHEVVYGSLCSSPCGAVWRVSCLQEVTSVCAETDLYKI